MTPLTRADLTELHNIQPLANVPSILEHGILSHDRAQSLRHESVAMEDVQDLRATVTIPGANRRLHTYADLYVNGRNKMLSKIKFARGLDEMCLLRVSTEVLELEGVVIADRNAACIGTVRELVFARYWNHPGEELKSQLHGHLICAEVLVPDCVEPRYIVGAHVSCTAAQDELRLSAPALPVTVTPYLFFR